MIPICQCCGQEMVMQKQTTASLKKGGKCRVRRFYCELCDITETLYADGWRDVITDPRDAVNDVTRMHKREEDNQNEIHDTDAN